MRKGSWLRLCVIVSAISVLCLTSFVIAEEVKVAELGPPSGWQLVYEHDEIGSPIAGDINKLINAVRNGADVKIGYVGTKSDGTEFDIFVPCESVMLFPDGQGATYVRCSNNSMVGDNAADTFRYFILYKTTGEVEHSRWNVGEHVNRGYDKVQAAMKWFIRR